MVESTTPDTEQSKAQNPDTKQMFTEVMKDLENSLTPKEWLVIKQLSNNTYKPKASPEQAKAVQLKLEIQNQNKQTKPGNSR